MTAWENERCHARNHGSSIARENESSHGNHGSRIARARKWSMTSDVVRDIELSEIQAASSLRPEVIPS